MIKELERVFVEYEARCDGCRQKFKARNENDCFSSLSDLIDILEEHNWYYLEPFDYKPITMCPKCEEIILFDWVKKNMKPSSGADN